MDPPLLLRNLSPRWGWVFPSCLYPRLTPVGYLLNATAVANIDVGTVYPLTPWATFSRRYRGEYRCWDRVPRADAVDYLLNANAVAKKVNESVRAKNAFPPMADAVG